MSKKTRNILFIVLGALLLLSLTAGYVLAKYTIEWDSRFGLHIYPKQESYTLTTGTALATALSDDTLHVVFGEKSEYTAEIDGLDRVHVGKESSDQIYLYYAESTKTAYILANKTINFEESSGSMFLNMSSLLSITFDNINTENVIGMERMFEGCAGLTELNLCSFSTTCVTDMTSMFSGCVLLETIYDDGQFVTDSVTASENMFLNTYLLVGGMGTRVYPVGETTTVMPLDKTHAWIDGKDDTIGYFTDKNDHIYFRSNLLQTPEMGADYTVNSYSTWLSVANALDSETYSVDPIEYVLTYEIFVDGAWKKIDALTRSETLDGDTYSVRNHTVSPIIDEGVTYDTVRVTAQRVGGVIPLVAIFRFDYVAAEVSYSYESGVIHMTVSTNDVSDSFTFSWVSGIQPDISDPNLILQTAVNGESSHALTAHTVYDFCFFITDPALLTTVSADPETQMPLAVSVEIAE